MARLFLIGAVVALLGLAYSVFDVARRPPSQAVALGQDPLTAFSPPWATGPTRISTASPVPEAAPIALVAGHSGGNDPGAVCDDGLREVDITTDVAQRTKSLLDARGYRTDILAEFDPRLSATRRDYSPRVFLSIHADSCVMYASGYKVARAANSSIPQQDDRLVRCLTAAYGLTTQLAFHSGSITNDMTQYHGLNEINPKSPGAIIELGFLGSEHNLLKNRRDLLAQGVAAGLIDFLSGSQCE